MSPTWSCWLNKLVHAQRTAVRSRRQIPIRLSAESLEDRTVPSVYNVTTTVDVLDANDGVLSLREAVLAANLSVGVADTINLPAGTYVLTLSGVGEDAAAAGDLDLSGDVWVQGTGAGTTVVDGNLSDRVFDVQAGTVSLAKLTVRNGRVAGLAGSPDAQGGGVRSRGTLILTGCVVTANRVIGADATATVAAGGAYGGGVYQLNNRLTLTDSTIADNQAQGGAVYAANATAVTAGSANGGGIYVTDGVLMVDTSTVVGNQATGGTAVNTVGTAMGGAATGGGIQIVFYGNSQLTASTIAGNSAIGGAGTGETGGNGGGASGGGLALWTFCTVSNGTISANQAVGGAAATTGSAVLGRAGDARGGGVFGQNGFITNSTVTLNAAIAGVGNRAAGTGVGGGSAGPAEGAKAVFRSSIIAGNTATTASPDVVRPVDLVVLTSQGNNLVGDGTGAPGFVNGVLGDQVGGLGGPALDARLGPLADNGGPTRTHALLADSPAINRGSNVADLATDQRGTRFPRRNGPSADVGAFEAAYVLPWATGPFSGIAVGGGTAYTFAVIYRDDVAVNVGTLGTGDVRVTGPGGFSTLATFVGMDIPTNGTPRAATYRFTPPGGFWNAADNGAYTVAVEANQVADTDGNLLPAGPVGGFQVNIPLPSASGTFADVTAPVASVYTFTVTYRDDVAIDVLTLGAGDVRVTGPNGFNVLAEFVGVDANINGSARVATYRFAPPGGTWDAGEVGTYTVSVEPNQVADITGDTVAVGPVGTFRLVLPTTFVVTTTADAGPGSLRDAMARANANSPAPDAIIFDPVVFGLPQRITLTSGQLAVTDSVTVRGPGADLLTISGNDASRVFAVDGPGRLDVSLSGLHLTHGRMIGLHETHVGGAVYVADENLTVTDCSFTANSAERGGGALGGGEAGGTLIIRRSAFTGNTVQNSGGAIGVLGDYYKATSVVLEDCTIANNSVIGSYGGGVYTGSLVSLLVAGCTITDNRGSPGAGLVSSNATIRDSIVSRNQSTWDGGGVCGAIVVFERSIIDGNTAFHGGGGIIVGTLTLLDSTVSNNQAQTGTGGGIVAGAIATIRNSTISGNSALSATGYCVGGAFFDSRGGGSIVIENSTVTANTARSGSGGLVIGSSGSPETPVTITSSILTGNTGTWAYDLGAGVDARVTLVQSAVGAASVYRLTAESRNNLPFGTDVRLGPLADNGGPTKTHALLPGSPAIDAGSNPAGLLFDQRGAYARFSGVAPDIGAYEVTAQIPSAVAVCPDLTTATSDPYKFTVKYFDDATVRVSSLGTGDVRVTGPNGFNALAEFVGVDVNADGTPRAATYRLSPPGGMWDLVDSGGYAVAIEPNQVADGSGNYVSAGIIGELRVYFPGVANTFSVRTTADDGPGSLRDAVALANLDAGSVDQVVFDPALYTSPQTITLTTGQIVVNTSLNIAGPGAGRLTVSGNDSGRLFLVDGPGRLAVTFAGMTLTGGNASDGYSQPHGGAVLVQDEALTVRDCTIIGNRAFADGGAIAVAEGGSLTVTGSTFANNSAQAGGGAIRAAAPVTVVGSTFANNTAEYGGGVCFVRGTAPPAAYPLTVLDSLFVGNIAATWVGGDGGALFVQSSEAIIRNSTFSGNRAVRGTYTHGAGGAIYFNQGVLTVENSTFTWNSADVFGGGIAAVPIGIGTTTPPLTTITSTIVSGNSSPTGPDVAGYTETIYAAHQIRLWNSAVGRGDDFLLAPDSANNLPFGTNPLLGPLADNGGPTKSHALLAGSPAINAGSNPANLTTDQRGAGFARVRGSASDIGAFEVQMPPVPVKSVVVNAGAAQRSMVNQLTVTFADLVTFTGQPEAAFQLVRTGPVGPIGNVALTVDLTGSTAAQTIARLTFSGPLTEGPAAAPSLIDGNYTLTVLSGQVVGGLSGGDSLTILYRLYGDVNGDRAVNGLDLAVFRTAFGTSAGAPNYVAALDQNGDGAINGLDLAEFRTRFGTMLP